MRASQLWMLAFAAVIIGSDSAPSAAPAPTTPPAPTTTPNTADNAADGADSPLAPDDDSPLAPEVPEIPEEKETSYMWLIGAGLSIIGSVCSNLGVNTQKWSFNANDKKPFEQQKAYFKQPAWVIGLVLVIVGSLGDFAALGLAAQSIVAPIGAVTLVANIIFAHFWLKEPLFCKDVMGTIFIITGSVLAVSFGSHEEREVTLDMLLDNFEQTGFIIYAIVVAVSVATMYALLKIIEPIRNSLGDTVRLYEEARDNKNKADSDKFEAEIDAIQAKYSKWEKLHPFLYCATSGVCGGQNILFGKCVAEMISASVQGNNQMDKPLTWVFVLCMLTSIFTQLHFLALALTYFDALYVVPVFQCFFITVSTLGGAAFFQEFATFGLVQGIMFPVGILLTLAGVYLLSSRKMDVEIDRSLQDFGEETEALVADKPEDADTTKPKTTEGEDDETPVDDKDVKISVDPPARESTEKPPSQEEDEEKDTFVIRPELAVPATGARPRAATHSGGSRPRVASIARKSYNPRVSISIPSNPVHRVSANLARISQVSNNPNRRVNRLSVFSLGGVM